MQEKHGIDSHVRALGQKYMGYRPSYNEDMFQDTSLKTEGGHDVLVDNFLNAQCMFSILAEALIAGANASL